MAAFPLKIAPKHNTKICYPSIAAVTAEMGVFLFVMKEVLLFTSKLDTI